MPKFKSQKLGEYYQNRNHVVGSEAWLTDEELEELNHPHNSAASKAARKHKLEELMGKPVRTYGNIRG